MTNQKYNFSPDIIYYYKDTGLSVSYKPNCIHDFNQEIYNIHLFYQENTTKVHKDILIEQHDRLQKQIDAMNIVIEGLNKKVDHYEEIIIPAEKNY